MSKNNNTLFLIDGNFVWNKGRLLDLQGPLVHTNSIGYYTTRIVTTCDTISVKQLCGDITTVEIENLHIIDGEICIVNPHNKNYTNYINPPSYKYGPWEIYRRMDPSNLS